MLCILSWHCCCTLGSRRCGLAWAKPGFSVMVAVPATKKQLHPCSNLCRSPAVVNEVLHGTAASPSNGVFFLLWVAFWWCGCPQWDVNRVWEGPNCPLLKVLNCKQRDGSRHPFLWWVCLLKPYYYSWCSCSIPAQLSLLCPPQAFGRTYRSISQPASASQTRNLLPLYLPDIHSAFGTSLGALGCSGFPSKYERLAKDEIWCTRGGKKKKGKEKYSWW